MYTRSLQHEIASLTAVQLFSGCWPEEQGELLLVTP
jgi:hypothetical protein